MTTKEIADVAGVTPESVRLKGKALFPSRFEHGKKTTFTQKEAIQIMGELRKKGFIELPRNLEELPKDLEVGSSLTKKDLEIISAIVSQTVAMTIHQLDSRLQKIETRVEERQALLPAPGISDKDAIRQLVNRVSAKTGTAHSTLWSELYTECYYRLHTNFSQRAKAMETKPKSILDLVDSEGRCGEVLAVAVDMWGAI